jgi:tetratricopeptide (TPR) repeat protein
LAIAKFDEGYKTDPDFPGSAPTLLNNKAVALINRAATKYNENVKAEPTVKEAAMVAVKKDFEDAVASTERALEILKNTKDATPEEQKKYEVYKYQLLANRKDAYQKMIKTNADRSKGKQAAIAFQEYLAVETDAKKKTDTQMQLAEALQEANESDMAIVEFEKILAQDPGNASALAGAGFSLVNVGYLNNDKAKLQQGSNYLQKFIEVAPDTNPLKNDAKGLVETLKKEQNVTPQKVATPGRKKN